MIHQIEDLNLVGLKPSEVESRDIARLICGMPRLTKLEVNKCSLHDGFYSQMKAGAPSSHVSFISCRAHDK